MPELVSTRSVLAAREFGVRSPDGHRITFGEPTVNSRVHR